MSADHVSGLIMLIVLGLLIATIYGPWQWYCIDQARQKLFEIRARVFNLAAEGRIAFESPHYRAIRDSLNNRLRFTHRVCWQQVLALAWAYPNLPAESELRRQIRFIEDSSLREVLEKESHQAEKVMAELIVFRSPFLLLTYFLLKPIGQRRELPSGSRQPRWQSAGERASIEAENIGPILDLRPLKAA